MPCVYGIFKIIVEVVGKHREVEKKAKIFQSY
jgi:hypothetical protein